MTKPLRIFIADDHELVRRGLRQLIEMNPDWQIAGEAANGREAVEGVPVVPPAAPVAVATESATIGASINRVDLTVSPAGRFTR